jgi:hypothetical protein
MDKRKRPRARAPNGRRGTYQVQVNLDADDYVRLYELMMQRNVSMQETLRQIIREASGRPR